MMVKKVDMDVDISPLAEVHIKEEDGTIEFENKFYDCSVRNNLNFVKQEPCDHNQFKHHFLYSEVEEKKATKFKRLCNECGKSFNRKEHLENHRRIHTGERPFKCKVCTKTFVKSYDLARHNQSTHGYVMTFFICEECGRTFSRKDHLKAHQMTHKRQIVGEEISSLLDTYVCETCGRAYRRLDNFKKHMQKHFVGMDHLKQEKTAQPETKSMIEEVDFHFMSENDVAATRRISLRSHSCKHCGRLFLRKDHLRNHERTHTGEKPFQCSECDRRFAKRFVMTRHLQNVHQINVKLHECSECERKFARSDHLKTHMKIHILAAGRNEKKEKAFKCGLCDSTFTRSDNLKTHMKIHEFDAVKKSHEENKKKTEKIE